MTALATELQSVFKSVILLHHHPRSLIQLTVQTMSAPPQATSTLRLTLDAKETSQSEPKRRAPLVLGPDQPFLSTEVAASINASTLALMDANIPLRATVIASACAIVPRGELSNERAVDSDDQEPSVILIDPTPEEEQSADSLHVLAFAVTGYEPTTKDDSNVHE
ncbi:exosome non-catalytic core subunit rrp46 [Malassezia equina]|uniref:Exosome non-catalytic core subunit rrp46 n=1 Tax=Malassezia equina TaxID=1381935 RepID=A0AAF0IZ98_9BASI|nr:exosome non-catalytic core subunit rrp46 [Malassezia equina]